MRTINTHKINPANDKIEILVADEPGQGGASHLYHLTANDGHPIDGPLNLGIIKFQNGPIAEHGVNGVTQEALLAIIIDRLQSFQAGPFKCRENAVALTHLETAKLWLFSRTLDRMQKGVEGTNQKRPEETGDYKAYPPAERQPGIPTITLEPYERITRMNGWQPEAAIYAGKPAYQLLSDKTKRFFFNDHNELTPIADAGGLTWENNGPALPRPDEAPPETPNQK